MTAVEEASAPTGLQGVPQARRSACCGGMRVLTHRPTSLDGAELVPVAVRPADEDERVAALGCVELGTW